MSLWTVPPNFAAGNALTEGELDTLSADLTFLKGAFDLITESSTADTGDATFLRILRALSTETVIGGGVTGDAFRRWLVAASGQMEWGSGAAARDVNLYRGAANQLKTDDDLRVGAGATGMLIIKVKAGALADTDFAGTATNGAIGWNSSNNSLYIRSAGVWRRIGSVAA